MLTIQVVEEEAAAPKDPTKFSGKKSKATAKKGQGSTQWDILRSSGIPEGELPEFRSACPSCLHRPAVARQACTWEAVVRAFYLSNLKLIVPIFYSS